MRGRRGRGGGRNSGAVTFAALVSFLYGALFMVYGVYIILVREKAKALLRSAGSHAGALGGVLSLLAFLAIVLGILCLAGGYGVIQRKGWGRVLSLFMTGPIALLGLWSGTVLSIGIAGFYVIVQLVILLRSTAAREFGR